MATISELRNRIKLLNVSNEAVDAIEDTKQTIIDKQRDQLLHGETGKGTQIGKYRNPVYAQKKFSQNPLAGLGNVDLKLTGAFQSEIFANVRENSIVIDSANEKAGLIIEKYGDPFGLTKESKSQYVNEVLRDKFLKQIKVKTGL